MLHYPILSSACNRHRKCLCLLSVLIFSCLIYALIINNTESVWKSTDLCIMTSFFCAGAPSFKHLNIIDLKKQNDNNFTCITTKRLLLVVRTTVCTHSLVDGVSKSIINNKIWEENLVSSIISLLGRYPDAAFIDAGANIGTYTMFAAAFGRDVISIECFKPNLERIKKAIQIEHLENKVVLVGNAIFSESRKYLKIESIPGNIGGQAIIVNSTVQNTSDIFVVKTIIFDDIFPLLQWKNIRRLIMKVDIQWSEVYLCETGSRIFTTIDIPVVLMEWAVVPQYKNRMQKALECFTARNYIATKDMCTPLDHKAAYHSWPFDIFLVKKNSIRMC